MAGVSLFSLRGDTGQNKCLRGGGGLLFFAVCCVADTVNLELDFLTVFGVDLGRISEDEFHVAAVGHKVVLCVLGEIKIDKAQE